MSLQDGSMGKSTFRALYIKELDTVAASVITATVFTESNRKQQQNWLKLRAVAERTRETVLKNKVEKENQFPRVFSDLYMCTLVHECPHFLSLSPSSH